MVYTQKNIHNILLQLILYVYRVVILIYRNVNPNVIYIHFSHTTITVTEIQEKLGFRLFADVGKYRFCLEKHPRNIITSFEYIYLVVVVIF